MNSLNPAPPLQTGGQHATLVGGGDANGALLKAALTVAPFLVAADGGAALASEVGLRPRAVVGDMDSGGAVGLDGVLRLARPDQDATDFQKCLDACDAPLFLGVGFLGGRLDHQLAAFTTLIGERRPVILLSDAELVFVAPTDLTLALPEETPIGLYPLLAARLTTTGLRYPLTDAAVAPDGLISTSNHVERGPVTIRSDRRALLVTLPRAQLGRVHGALSG